jgi:membrane-bound lytic murein transglycosylase D
VPFDDRYNAAMRTTLTIALAGLILANGTGIAQTTSPPPETESAIEVDQSTPQTQAMTIESDLWQRVRRGFVMGELNSPLVQDQELWYANRPDYIKRFVERGSRYLYHIMEEVEKRGMPTEIVLLPIIESAFNPQAYSRANASGMWQFIPSTGKNFGLKQDWMTDNRRDVLLSTNAALDYLSKLYGMFNSWEHAFAAYNCGEGCVGRAIAYNQKRGLPTDFSSLRLPNETKAYVPKLIAVKNIILSPASYGIDLPPVENRPFFSIVPAPEKIDVSLAAKLAEMETESFNQLNPAFSKPVASSGTGFFLVPVEHADIFKFNLDLYRTLNAPMVSWTTVSAKKGESVDAVARQHGMTAAYMRATNGPFREKKGRFTAPVNFMAPNPKDANAIREAFDKKVALKREQLYGAITDGDDGPLLKSPTMSGSLRLVGLKRDNKNESSSPRVAANLSAELTATTGNIDAPAAPNDAVTTTIASAWMTYQVVQGDTLFSIAKRAGLPLSQVKAENQLQSNTIARGQVLRVPTAAAANFAAPVLGSLNTTSAAIQTATPRSGISPKSSPTRKTSTYVVRSGDTLYGIARKFQTTVDSLLAINRLKANSILRPGARISIVG